jgi:hypothetical protein
MNWWELASRPHNDGYFAELPPGKYYYGDCADMCSLGTGIWTSLKNDDIVCLAPIGGIVETTKTVFPCFSGTLALSSEGAFPDFEDSDDCLTIDKRFTVTYSDNALILKWDDNTFQFSEYCPEETDDEMYSRLYALQGITY